MDTEAIKQRIRKLLNLATNDAAAEGEIENALTFARRLMDEHALTEADIATPEDQRRTPEDIASSRTYLRRFIPLGSTKLSQWESTAGAAVCAIFSGHVQFYRTQRMAVKTATGLPKYDEQGAVIERVHFCFYGPDDEVHLACEIFETLCLTISTMARLRFGSIYRNEGRSYAEGFTVALHNKVRADTTPPSSTLPAGAPSTAIVLASVTKAIQHRSRSFLEDQGVKLCKGSGGGGGRHHSDAYSSGKADGARYTLTRPTTHRRIT